MDLRAGDTIHIKGHTTDLVIDVDLMQIDRAEVGVARAGQSVGVKVPEHERAGDHVKWVEC